MSTAMKVLTTEVQLRLLLPGAAARPMRAALRYDPSDPYAITTSFQVGATEVVVWTFARQLLQDGLTTLTGGGDVQVWPSASAGAAIVCLSLSSPSGKALFEVPHSALAAFLHRTYAVIPAGAESRQVDVDAELALLLWAEPER